MLSFGEASSREPEGKGTEIMAGALEAIETMGLSL
jgi:hypothetical protein